MVEPTPLDYEAIPPLPRQRMGIPRRVWVWIIVACLGLPGMLWVAVVIFAIQHDPEPVYRERCASNLRQIATAITMYTDNNKGKYPDRLSRLVTQQDLWAQLLICPDSNDQRGPGLTAAEHAAAIDKGGRHCSYIYVGMGLRADCEPGRIVMFDDPANHQMDGACVLYGDGRAAFRPLVEIVQLVPELEAGRNPPTLAQLSKKQAKAIYQQRWEPILSTMHDGSWVAKLPISSTRSAPVR